MTPFYKLPHILTIDADIEALTPRARLVWELLAARAIARMRVGNAERDYRIVEFVGSVRVIARRRGYLEGVRGELFEAQYRYERAEKLLGAWDQ